MTVVGRGLVVSGSGSRAPGARRTPSSRSSRCSRTRTWATRSCSSNSPSATAIVPLLSKVRGIVCADGGMTSHLAIVSREFGLPCVMAADVGSLGDLDGKAMTVSAEGEIAVG